MAAPKIIIDKINSSYFQLNKISSSLIKKMMDKFAYLPPGYKYNPRFRLMGINGVKVRMVNADGTFPAGMLDDIIAFLKLNKKEFELSDAVKEHKLSLLECFEDGISDAVFSDFEFSPGNPVKLRDYQVEAIEKAFEERTGLLNLSTGAGKCLAGNTKIRIKLPKNIINKFNLKNVK